VCNVLLCKWIVMSVLYVKMERQNNFLDSVAANKEATEPRVPLGQVTTSKVVRSWPWLGWPLWNICVTNDHGYVPLVVTTSRSFPHSWFITGFTTRFTRWVPLVEQELLTLPEHLSSSRFLMGFVLLDL